MIRDDSDVKKYKPQKSVRGKSAAKDFDMEAGSGFTPELSEEYKDLRRREENYIFRGYGTMMDTSEVIDFADGE